MYLLNNKGQKVTGVLLLQTMINDNKKQLTVNSVLRLIQKRLREGQR